MGATPVTAATLGFQALGSLAGGQASYEEAQALAAQRMAQGKAEEIRGMEVEASLRDTFISTMSSFRAARGANGLNLTSPTALAIAGGIRSAALRDIMANKTNTQLNVDAALAGASAASAAGRYGLLGGYIGAFKPLASMAQTLMGK